MPKNHLVIGSHSAVGSKIMEKILEEKNRVFSISRHNQKISIVNHDSEWK